MNDMARRIVMDRQRRMQDSARADRDYASEDYARRAMDYARRAMDYARRNNDMRLSDPIGTEPEYPQEMMWDGKQGVKGTGPYGIGERLYSRSRDYREYDYDDDDYETDGRRRRNMDYEMDGHHPSGLMRLKKKDFKEWERNLENLKSGSLGDPKSNVTLLRYWQCQERAHYPHARENVEYFTDVQNNEGGESFEN